MIDVVDDGDGDRREALRQGAQDVDALRREIEGDVATSERMRPMRAPGIFGLIFSLTTTIASTTAEITIAYQFQTAKVWKM